MSLLLLLGPNAHPPSGAAHGTATVVGNFPGRLALAMGATGVATASAGLGLSIRFKQSGTGTATTTGSTLTVPLTALAVGDLVVVVYAANYAPNSVTGTGVTFSAPTNANFFYGKVTSAGGTGVTVNWTAGTPMNVHVLVFANADVALDDTQWNGNNTTNAPIVGSASDTFGNGVTPVAGGNLVVAMAQWNTTSALSATGGGFTSTSADIGATTTFRSVAAWRVYASTTQSPAASWTLSASTTWQARAIVIVPTQVSVPPAPQNPRIYHQNNGAQLDWDVVPGASAGYKVYESGVLVATVNGGFSTGASTLNTANIFGLSPGASKSYTVRAINSFGESADSASVAFIAAACPNWTTRNKYPATNPPTVASTTQSLTQVGVAGQAYVLSVVIHDGTTSVTGVTGGGATWQRAGRQVNSTNSVGVELWYALGVAAGSDTITATVSASVLFNIDLAAVTSAADVEGFNTLAGTTAVSGGAFITLPVSGASTDGAFFVAVVGEDNAQFTPDSTAQSLPFSDNVMADGGGFTSKTWFVQGMGAGTDPRMGSGLKILSTPNARWAAVSMVFTRAKVQLASTPTGAGSGSGSLSVGHSSVTLAATPASAATASAAVRVIRAVAGSATSVATSSATFKVARGLASAATGLGVVTSAVVVSRTLASASVGQGAASVSLAVRRALAVAVVGQGVGSADATVIPASLAGDGAGTASAAGSAGVTYSVTASVAGQGATVASAVVRRGLLGAAVGTGAGAADVALRLALIATASGDAACVVSTSVLRAMSANSSAIATVAGGARVRYALSAAPAGAAGAGAALIKGPLLAGKGDGLAGSQGAARITRTLAVAIAGHGLVSSTASQVFSLTGVCHGASVTLPGLGLIRPVTGAAGGSGSVTATGAVRRGLQGAADGQAGQSTAMVFRVHLAARVDGVATTSGAALRDRGFVVSAAGIGHVSATLWDALPQIAGHAMVLAPRELSPTQRLAAQGSVLVLEARGTGEGVRALDRAMTLTADAAI